MASTPVPALPTFNNLGISPPTDIDAVKIAGEWLEKLQTAISPSPNGDIDIDKALDLFRPDAFWRDIVSLTWDFRTFFGTAQIKTFLQDRIANPSIDDKARLNNLKLETASVGEPDEDITWIEALFTFSIGTWGAGDGVFRLVLSPEGVWKAFTVYTNLQSLTDYPEKVGALRNPLPNHGKWAEQRRKEIEFEGAEPYVLIIGGGQSGLDLGARLKFLDIPTLIVEKYPRVGDQWRNRYQALCLHDPVWYDHMPYLPFPPNWPVWTPAQKLADWLESYAKIMELNVWTSSTVTSAEKDPSGGWIVNLTRILPDGTESQRVLRPTHLVFATGLGSGSLVIPKFSKKEEFDGEVIHAFEYTTAKKYIGKKVIVVGAATSGHDVAHDLANHGTLYQRSPVYVMSTKNGCPAFMSLYVEGGHPTDIADRLGASFPLHLAFLLHQRVVKKVAAADKDILDGLTKKGFKLTNGPDDAGFASLAYRKAGGYYFDVGASQLIIDGKIGLKNDSVVKEFTKTGLKFEDDSTLEANLVVFATGLGDARDGIKKILGEELGGKVKPIWGLDSSGEAKGAWRDIGIDNLWYMMGNLAMCRYHSRHVALQIKAMKEGLFTGRYSSDEE
ncbi:hypothetical protein BJ322DRAFT_1012818 [Thelephora terrestris]|uniref:Flavin-containing monooxygenase n=1 Tax=Thelephora terrestris TaxID=56493 RepID=A0A9P6L2T0_9AGAM|nr:hypothetical protein BJ322DRAFT_1012818 [Thelephora terrestris]